MISIEPDEPRPATPAMDVPIAARAEMVRLEHASLSDSFKTLSAREKQTAFLVLMQSSYVVFEADDEFAMPELHDPDVVLKHLPKRVDSKLLEAKAKFDWLKAEDYRQIVEYFKARCSSDDSGLLESISTTLEDFLNRVMTREEGFFNSLSAVEFGEAEVKDFFGERANFVEHLIQKKVCLSKLCKQLHELAVSPELETVFPQESVLLSYWSGHARNFTTLLLG